MLQQSNIDTTGVASSSNEARNHDSKSAITPVAATGAGRNWRDDLAALPSDFRLVRVGRNKAPLAGDRWFDVDDLSPDDALRLNGSGPPAWGLKLGPASGGVLGLDLDADGWEESFEEVTGHPVSDLPRTIGWTSGKPGRSGHAFAVDREWWPQLRNRVPFTRPWREGDPLGKNGKQTDPTLWELRWDRHQSVIMGAHPETSGYRWLEGRSPREIPDPAPAPDWLLEHLLVRELPNVPQWVPSAEDSQRAMAMLECLPAERFTSYDDWLRVGMALHHTDDGLFSAWVDWCRAMSNFDEAECLAKWQSFGKGHRGRPATIATLHYLAKQHGYREPRHKERSQPPAEHPQDRQEATPLFEPPASLGELFNALPDGWVTSREGPRLSPLSPGLLARNLEQLGEWLRFNELALKAEVLTTRGWQVVQDEHLNDAMVQLSQNGWTIAQELVDKAVNYVARQRSIHPVREYLLSLESRTDLEPFDLDEVAPRFFKTTNPLHIAMWRKWLIGAAARALDPGCQMDYVLVLHSASQGMKKSSAFGVLGNGYHTSSVPDNDKDFILNLHSHWLFELAELDHVTSKRASGHLKNLITTRQDSFRVPYGRTTQKRPRQSVFCGTVNKAEFLKDETGNRRYWVVPLEAEVDLPALEKARDAIWLGAVRAHRAGELPMLSREQEQASEGQNASHLAVDPWADHVEALLKGSPKGRPVRVPDVLSHLHIPLERHTREAARRVCAIAEGLGWVHDRRTVKGQKLQGLWPPTEQVVGTETPSTGHPRTPQDTPRGVQANASDASASQLQDTPDTPFSSKVQKGDMNTPEGGSETTPAKRPSPMFEEMGCLGCPPQQSDCDHTLLGVSGGVSVGCPGVSSGVSLEENKRSTRKPPITEEELERALQAAIASGNLRKFLPDVKGHPPLVTTEVDQQPTCHPPEAEAGKEHKELEDWYWPDTPAP